MPLSAAQYRMRRLFTEDFNAADIADPLPSFDDVRDAGEVRAVMERIDAAVAGVRVDGRIAGYHDVFQALAVFETVFVTSSGTVTALIQRSDLQSAPVRMWLFGLITILDSFVTRELEARFPGDSWVSEISAGRAEKAKALLAERQRRDQEARLVECLQFADKAGILVRDPERREEWGMGSKRQADRLIQDLQSLRNNLAHTQDILTYDWETILELAQRLDGILTRI